MAEKKHEYTTYDETLRGPNKERDIDDNDWRDPDVTLDWDKGWFLQEQATGRVVMEFKGPCPSPFRESLLEGRELVGVIVARDFQRHN
jgi:hypothetical protein